MGKCYFIVSVMRFGPVIFANSECIDVAIAIVAMIMVCRYNFVGER